jgi:hypothetical protein
MTNGLGTPTMSRHEDDAGAAKPPIILVESLVKRYGAFVALNSVSLTVGKG